MSFRYYGAFTHIVVATVAVVTTGPAVSTLCFMSRVCGPTTLACIINFMRTIQMFRAHLKAHTRLLAFFLTKETPTHERTAVQNICMRSTSRLGEICS